MRLRRLPADSAAGHASSFSSPNVLVDAPAKLNLTLEVVGKRADGFHELRSLMIAIDLRDRLALEPAPDGSLRMTCDTPGLSVGPDNLVMKAARLLREETGTTRGAAIHLTKKIPWAAGLGGGSSDAASTLAGLNELWELGLTRHELARLGGRLGSDIGFFFDAPAAWCWGRGEKTRPVRLGAELNFVLISPTAGLSTPEVFRELNCTKRAEPREESFAPEELVEALGRGDIEALSGLLRNDLQEAAMRISPTVREWHSRLRAAMAGRAGCLMSGSGSSLFALCRDHREALRVREDLRHGPAPEGTEHARVSIVRTCN